MRKFTDEIRDYILENLDESGRFTKTYKQISEEIGVTQQQSRNAMLSLIKEGTLITITAPSKGKNSSPIYALGNKSLSKLISSQEDKSTVLELEFGGVILHIIQTEIGGCISKEELATATLEREDLIDKIIKANKEQFSRNMVIIDGKTYLNRMSVMNYLMKLNTENVLNVKKQVLIELQNSVLDKMCSSILEGRIILTENERIKIRHNLSCLTDIKKEDVEKLFLNLEEQIESLVSGVTTLATKQKVEINKLEREVKHLSGRIIQERSAKEILITQTNELKAKLMERN